MKHTLLKTATVLAVATLSSQAFAEPKISGRLYLSSLYEKTETKTTTDGVSTTTKSDARPTLNSGGSRIRFTGSEKINDTTDLEYRLEYNVKLDDDNVTKEGKNNNFTSRTTYVGLKHKDYGTVHFGRMYTPDDDIDYVNQAYLYSTGASNPFSYHGQRTNNTIQYTTPKFNNDKTQIKLHYAMDEDFAVYKEGANNNGGSVSTFVDGKSTSVKRDLVVGHILHEDEKFDAGLSYTHAGDDFSAVRGMFSYKPTKELTLGVMAQHVDYNSKDNELGFIASAYYQLNDSLDIYGQAGHTTNFGGVKDATQTVGSIGAIKWLKKEGTRVRAFASTSYANDSTKGANKTDKDTYSVETGLRVDF